MNIAETVKDIPRTKVLVALVVIGILILVIDISINGLRGTTINTSVAQLVGLGLIVGGSFLATYLKATCKND